MSIQEILENRFSTRAISPQPLSEQQLDRLAQAARLTPSCYNKQPWRFLFLVSEAARSKGSEALAEGNRTWASRAPLLVVAHSSEADDCQLPDGRKYHQFDLGMAVMNLMLAATEMGLVARPMAGFDPSKISEAFDIPEQAQPLVMVAVGRPSDDSSHLPDYAKGLADKPRERKPLEEIISRL